MKPPIQINIPYPLLLTHLDLIVAKRLNPEIYFDGKDLDEYKEKDLERISQILRENQLQVTFHAPYLDLSPGSLDSRIREVTQRRFQQILEVTPFFQPKAIVFHAGYDRWFYEEVLELWLEASIETWEEVAKKAKDLGTVIALENVFEESPYPLKKLFEALISPCFGFCFDVGHFYLFSKGSLEEWLELLGERMVEVHLHDNHKSSDDHLPLGEGEINFEKFFRLLPQFVKGEIIYTVEPHQEEKVEKSFTALKPYLRF